MSQRQAVPASPIPSFSRRYHTTGTGIVGAGSVLLRANAAVTALWVVIQSSAAGTIQLLENNEPASIALTIAAGQGVRFPGRLLANNATVSFSFSVSTTISFEVCWIKEFHDELITQTDTTIFGSGSGSGSGNVDIFDSTGLAITAASDAPVGTESALITRDILRKKQTLLTNTPLLAAGVFTSAWFDSELTGTRYVDVLGVSNVAALATTGLQLQQSADQANIFNVGANGAALQTRIGGVIRYRYWRVVYTNGASNQATFSLYATESSIPYAGDAIGNNTPEVVVVGTGNTAAGVFADGVSNQSAALFTTTGGLGGTQRSAGMLFNGTTWDRPRSNAATTTGDTGAKVATFNGATQTNFDSLGAFITILLGAVSGTTPTLALQLQYSPDGGTTWLNLGPALATLTASNQTGLIGIFPTNFSQAAGTTPVNLTNGATQSMFINAPLPRTWRIVYTITGTTPSFAISSVNVNYQKG